jgi:hypothetical protein
MRVTQRVPLKPFYSPPPQAHSTTTLYGIHQQHKPRHSYKYGYRTGLGNSQGDSGWFRCRGFGLGHDIRYILRSFSLICSPVSLFFPPVEDDHRPVVRDRLLLRLHAVCGSMLVLCLFYLLSLFSMSYLPYYLMLRIVDRLWSFWKHHIYLFISLKTSRRNIYADLLSSTAVVTVD